MLNNWINKKLPAGSFLRSVVTLMTGTTFAQVVMILIMPVLTRLYSPENFGVYALYGSIAGILSVIACWRYEIAIVLPEKDEDGVNLLFLSIIIVIIMSVITLFLVFLFRNKISEIMGMPELAIYLWFLPISLFLAGTFQALNYWSTRNRKFRRLAIQQIAQSSVSAGSQLTGGLVFASAPGGLIGGLIIGQFVANARLIKSTWEDDNAILKAVSIDGIKKQAHVYREFPCYQIWAALLNVVSSMTPVLLLGYFFSPAIVGFYALGQRVVTAPMGIIAGSIAQVFYPRAEIARREGNLDKLVLQIFQYLLYIGVLPIIVIAIIGPWFIELIFGNAWGFSGVFIRLLAPYLMFNFLFSPISTVFLVLNKQKEFLFFNLCYLILAVLALVCGGIVKNEIISIVSFSFVTTLVYLIFGALIFRYSGIKLYSLIKAVSQVLIQLLPIILIILFVMLIPNTYVLVRLLLIVFTIILYYGIIIKKGLLNY